LNLLSEIDFQWEEFADFPEKEFIIRVTKGGGLYWAGYPIPDNYSEPWESAPYEVSVTAIDYMTVLKDMDFTDHFGKIIYDRLLLVDVVRTVLGNVGLGLDMVDGIGLSRGSSSFSKGVMGSTSIDCRNFIKDIYTDKEKPMSCYEVLAEILTVFGAT